MTSLGRAYIIFEADGEVFEMQGQIVSGTLDVEYPEPDFRADELINAMGTPDVQLDTRITGHEYRIYRGASPFAPQQELQQPRKEIGR